MNIIFMGTPDFAIPSLKKIHDSKHTISAVVTAPDKERGRGQIVTYTPVKEYALENALHVLQPVSMKDPGFIEELKNYNADLFVIVAFRILPKEVFTLPAKGSFNLHASLLPRFRGAAPIQWALIKGEKETGVTTFALEEKVDTGNIYMQKKISIEESDNFGSLHYKLSQLGAQAVIETIDIIEAGNYELMPQDGSLASPAPKITKTTAEINWRQSAEIVHNLIRGMSPYPGAYFVHNDKQIKIYRTAPVSVPKLNAGQILADKTRLFIGCAEGSLEVFELQLQGKKKMGAAEFLRGYKF